MVHSEKIQIHLFFCFTIGFVIGFILFDKIISSDDDSFNAFHIKDTKSNGIVENETVKFKTPKILCIMLTSQHNHETKAIHLKNTWGKHCDKLIFTSTKTDNNLGSIGFPVNDDYKHLWSKIKLVFHYVYKNFVDDYDWIFKGDDDTFAIMENMKYLLSAYSPQDLIYFGHRFKFNYNKTGYCRYIQIHITQ